jgi:predicted enzyme involved in methoxymalonyl-ACP biosynthesis
MVPEADGNGRLVFLTADLVKFKPRAAGADARKIKCVVWDLDNTLWKGTLVEGDEVALNPGIEELLKYFDERGILLSVVSKNDFDPAVIARGVGRRGVFLIRKSTGYLRVRRSRICRVSIWNR